MADEGNRDVWWWYIEELASLAKQGIQPPQSTSISNSQSSSQTPEAQERAVQKVIGERGKWAPFNPLDRERLEQAWNNSGRIDEGRCMAVSGHSGQRLWLADLEQMEMSPMYWKGGSIVPLRRSFWMAMPGAGPEEDVLGGIPCPSHWDDELECVVKEHADMLEYTAETDESYPQELLVQLGGALSGYMLQLKRGIKTMATLIPLVSQQITSSRGLGLLMTSLSPPPKPIRLFRGYTAYYGGVITAINNPSKIATLPPPQSTASPTPNGNIKIPPSPFETFETLDPAPVKHVVFVVHGIGQKLAEKVGHGFVAAVNSLRRYVLSSGQTLKLQLEDVYILPIQWRVDLDMGGGYFASEASEESTEKEFDSLLTSITLQSVPAVRTLATDVTMDVLLYMTPRHFNRITEACVKELRRAYALFLKWNSPANRETKFSIIGHSLGSALVADVLGIDLEPQEASMPRLLSGLEAVKERLGFDVEHFFCFGSPLPLFMMLRHVKPIACAHHPDLARILKASDIMRCNPAESQQPPKMGFLACHQLYNLFMPYDPVAYRMEPLIVPPALRGPVLDPVQVPYYKGGLKGFKIGMSESLSRTKQDVMEAVNRNLPAWFKSKLNSPLIDDTVPKETEAETLLKAFNSSGRLDYALQDSVLENAYLSSVSSHFSYWSDQDVAAFLLSQLFKSS